jgi:hypothetical protein
LEAFDDGAGLPDAVDPPGHLQPNANQARKDLKSWCNWVKQKAEQTGHALLEPMAKVARMVEHHLEGILGHWKEGLTMAFLEGLNSLFFRHQTESSRIPQH